MALTIFTCPVEKSVKVDIILSNIMFFQSGIQKTMFVERIIGENINSDFFGADSIRFSLIEDSCTTRAYDIVGVNPGLRRVKTK
ncbi:MAG: hypothetical protein JST17_15385 [Bacteroidetes bacterium]|nr:hypothetical protein [Bacteroidota bacterium]MBS1930567.1 hypothetical protein [Bacteroidota bacterium]